MDQAPKQILDLADRFERNIESYRHQAYNEAQVRQEFINPFFEALGWDITNRKGHAEAYKDVIHEDAIKIGSATKAPDYCFRIGGVRKFFLEAKKPSISVKDDADPAYQLRRYAWSAKLPLSILTDFEEFAVYDCRIRPRSADKPSVGRILYFTYKEYPARWDEIASVFSKEAVLRGSFDKFVTSKGRRGTSEVDAEFLSEIEGWRDALARNIALRNALGIRELNFAVQRTIDRIIFLRMCEDRGIELYGQLAGLLNGENTYDRLQYIYRLADDRYNSGLFHFKSEKGRKEDPDELTLQLRIDDKVLKEIIRHLYYPESPYEFSVLSADILGNVYEQFLGKVIRLTSGRRAVVEEKPEVKKAGGVYYTPVYIVDYIVRNTVGKLCEGKTPKQIAKIRILDPACGSGSFLIGAYTFLINHHRDWYVNDGPEKHTKEIYQGAGGQWHLTAQEKKRILLNNIYGVDIDSQAVEVTKLSLLLKVLEGENRDSLSRQLKMWRERALPDLGSNIKCGNSLIRTDYYIEQQVGLFDNEEEARRVNAFDWQVEFSQIMKGGGFDSVIGNPPYIRIQTLKESAPIEVEIYKKHYVAAGHGNYDIYVIFVEKGLSLLNKTGRLGFILPHKFFNAQYGEPLRKLISEKKHLSEIVHFGDQQVFSSATTYTCLLFLDKSGVSQSKFHKIEDISAWRITGQAPLGLIPADTIHASEWVFGVGASSTLFNRLSKMPLKLSDIADRIFQGLVTGADPVFTLENLGKGRYFSQATQEEHKLEPDLMHPLCKGSLNIKRYNINELTLSILFPYKLIQNNAHLLSVKELAEKYPGIWEYLKANKALLESREHGKWKHERWYAFGRSQNLTEMEQVKILTPSIAKQASFTLDSTNFYYFLGSGGGGGGGYGITLKKGESIAYEYVLGLMNSKLLDSLLKAISSPFRGGYYAYNRQYIEQLPIRPINLSDTSERMWHDKMVELVQKMLGLHKKAKGAKAPTDIMVIRRQIDATDKEIDQLVYKLYDLTPEEIAIVEESAVDSERTTRDNTDNENEETESNRSRPIEYPASSLAKEAQHAREDLGRTSGGAPGAGGSVDVVREPAGGYRPPDGPPEEGSNQIESTRRSETAQGKLSYPEVSERLAVALTQILNEILQASPDDIVITSEWFCVRHKSLAGNLFPDWAGRYRDVNVQVGAHMPPPFYEVPILMRLFSEDLGERLRHIQPRESGIDALAELLAWADWRFQWIHPFKDFNGRIGRVLLAALLYKLALPHVVTAPLEANSRSQYLQALREADNGSLSALTDVWTNRIAEIL